MLLELGCAERRAEKPDRGGRRREGEAALESECFVVGGKERCSRESVLREARREIRWFEKAAPGLGEGEIGEIVAFGGGKSGESEGEVKAVPGGDLSIALGKMPEPAFIVEPGEIVVERQGLAGAGDLLSFHRAAKGPHQGPTVEFFVEQVVLGALAKKAERKGLVGRGSDQKERRVRRGGAETEEGGQRRAVESGEMNKQCVEVLRGQEFARFDGIGGEQDAHGLRPAVAEARFLEFGEGFLDEPDGVWI